MSEDFIGFGIRVMALIMKVKEKNLLVITSYRFLSAEDLCFVQTVHSFEAREVFKTNSNVKLVRLGV